ncbi:MAG TPA: dienelactone hydrolase family protein [Candidatus Aquabacterium excrementipullorum]|nr:dienelactone hydrolase family protein [Candidatus Aquabacterium excrementipullorum]
MPQPNTPSTPGPYARAAEPGPHEPIHTSADGLLAGLVDIPVKDGVIPAYRAVPAEPGAYPLVLVVQEIFGLHEHIEDVVRRFAKRGYLAIAPALYARLGDPAQAGSIDQVMQNFVYKTPDTQVLADLDATLAWADQHHPFSGQRPVGITGFCWGGRATWLYAAHQPRVRAGVAWYGRLEGKTSEITPRQPADVAAELKAPVLGLYGGKDTGIPLDTVERMQAALAREGKGSEIHVYPDAPHAFFADYRPSYHPAEARDGWTRTLDWFQRHGMKP